MNNYDQSSTGVDISLEFYYDSDMANMRCRDFLRGDEFSEPSILLKYSTNRGRLAYLVIVEDPNALMFTKSRLKKMTKEECIGVIKTLENPFSAIMGYSPPHKEPTKADIVEYLGGITVKDYYDSLWQETGFKSVPYDFDAVGYSQGDLVRVKIHTRDKFKFSYITSEYISQILWDIPIYFRLEVHLQDGGYTIDFDMEEIKDEYEWNDDVRKELIKGIGESLKKDIRFHKHHNYITGWLNINMPINPR